MAKRASAAQVSADIAKQDFKGAVATVRQIVAKKSKIGEINADIGAIYDRIEGGMKVSKKSLRDFLKMDKMEPDERTIYLRDINGMIAGARDIGSNGWAETEIADLVDQSQGKVVEVKMGGSDKAQGSG